MKNPFIKLNAETNFVAASHFLHSKYGNNVHIGPNSIEKDLPKEIVNKLIETGYLSIDKNGWYQFIYKG